MASNRHNRSSRRGPCYACGQPSSTREHVPPECVFPAAKDTRDDVNLRRQLTTVPSCEVHNLKKSADDFYFLLVVCCNLPANSIARRQVETKIARALRLDSTLFGLINVDPKDVVVFESHSGRQHDAVQLALDGPRFERVFDLIARGLFWHHYGEPWLGHLRVVPDFIDYADAPDPSSLNQDRITLFECAEQLFANDVRQGENPDVFWFKVHGPEGAYRSLMRLSFYDACTATAFFGGDPKG